MVGFSMKALPYKIAAVQAHWQCNNSHLREIATCLILDRSIPCVGQTAFLLNFLLLLMCIAMLSHHHTATT